MTYVRSGLYSASKRVTHYGAKPSNVFYVRGSVGAFTVSQKRESKTETVRNMFFGSSQSLAAEFDVHAY